MFLMIDNYDSFTYNLVQAFQMLGHDPVVVRNDDARLLHMATSPELTMACISPGPGHPSEAGLCAEFLKRLPRSVPVLGVCLGHQVLGTFAGASVTVGKRVMHGKSSDITHDGRGLFANMPALMNVGRYHSLFVNAEEAPQMLEVTARSADDPGEVMAIRYLDRPWVGVQFHPESVLTPQGMDLLANFPEAVVSGATGARPAAAVAAAVSAEEKKKKAIVAVLDKVATGRDLTTEQASMAFDAMIDGEMSPVQAGAFLTALRLKGETPVELAAAADCVIKRAKEVPVDLGTPLIDIVGTGGDGRSSFNCSTVTAIILGAMGHRVCKHGNRAVSSTSGAADVIEGLGLPLETAPEDLKARLDKTGFVFLFAPYYHRAFANIIPVRRDMGIATLFNLLGPLVNPARPTHMVLGVAARKNLYIMAETLAATGVARAAVIHGAGRYDELTTIGLNTAVIVENGKIVGEEQIDPFALGFKASRPEDLTVHSKEEAASVARALLMGDGPEPIRETVMLNVAMALNVIDREKPLAQCAAEARAAVEGAAARRTIENA